MKTSRKEIMEIFFSNQYGWEEEDYVMPTINEWNKIGAHIDELTALVEELKSMVAKQQSWLNIDPEYQGSPLEVEANQLLNRIGRGDE